MTSSLAIQHISRHVRSVSLPSNSLPLTVRVEEQLCQLRSSQQVTSSSSSICHDLASLLDLYQCVSDLLQSPLAQQSLSVERNRSLVDHVLDGSVKLLDVCENTKEIMSQVKQSVQDLQSSLRRRGRKSDVTSEVCAYMTSRKKGAKLIHKCLTDMKKMEHVSAFDVTEKDIAHILCEVETVTVAVFQSLLSFVSKARSKQTNWSLVSLLKPTRTILSNDITEMEVVDATLKTLIDQKSCKGGNIQGVQKPLEALRMSIQGFEDELDCLFRRLIKIRVSVLNIVNQL